MRPVQPPAFSNNQLEGHSAERMPQPYGRATPTQRSGWSGSVRIQNPDYDPDHSQELMVSMYRRISSQKIPSKSRNLQVLQILVQDKILLAKTRHSQQQGENAVFQLMWNRLSFSAFRDQYQTRCWLLVDRRQGDCAVAMDTPADGERGY